MKKGFGFSKLSLGLNLKWGSGSIFEVGKKLRLELKFAKSVKKRKEWVLDIWHMMLRSSQEWQVGIMNTIKFQHAMHRRNHDHKVGNTLEDHA